MVADNPLLGTFLHAFGAFAAALCYTPQQKLRGWSWQTYWLAQASICWLIAPIAGAWLTIPDLGQVLSAAPKHAMTITFLLGVVYGVGGTAFGLAIKHIGYSLTYAIAIGISCVLGTLAGPILGGTLQELIQKQGASWVMTGMLVGFAGTLLCGVAGRWKEQELLAGTGTTGTFSLGKGLALCLLAGVLSAIYGVAVNDTGKPIAETAARFGAGHWEMNVVYIFSNTGAFCTTLAYTLWLGFRQKTFGEFRQPAGAVPGALRMNYAMALLTGCLWYSQFLFYGLGHVRMGQFKFSSWAIHMIMLILFSALAGVALREWHGRRLPTRAAIAGAIVVLVTAVLMLTYGNWLGEQAAIP